MAFEVTLFLPIVVVLGFNFVVFFLVLRRLKQSLRVSKQAGVGDRKTYSEKKKMAIRSALFAFLLGLTWVTGLFMFDTGSLVLQYTFTILVSLQGFALFLLQCMAGSVSSRKRSPILRCITPSKVMASSALSSRSASFPTVYHVSSSSSTNDSNGKHPFWHNVLSTILRRQDTPSMTTDTFPHGHYEPATCTIPEVENL